MKNLKRVLSLGLAAVMLVGMMVVGASAKDFTDADQIQHNEAVSVLVALGIVNGKEDGSYFAPTDTVTRGEMAKMIAVALQGGSEATTGVKTVPSFTDIGGHWAESWIEYCADIGVISGRGDGTFDPNGNVTGLEVTKMVLTALGYEAEPYKLIGAQWATNVDKLARTASPKLYKELDNVVMNQPANRDVAAQIIWNGLQNLTRVVSPDQNTNSGEVTWKYGASTKTLIEERYDAYVKEGTYEGNHDYDAAMGGTDKGDIIVNLALSGGNKMVNFPNDMSIENLGEKVKVIWKDGKGGTKGEPDRHDTIFGVFNTGETKVVRGNLSQVKSHKVDKQQVNLNGTIYEVADTVSIHYNYNKGGAVTYTKAAGDLKGSDAGTGSNSRLTDTLSKHTKDPFKAAFNDKNQITDIYITRTWIAAVTAVNSSKINLNNPSCSLVIADHDVEEGLKVGDVVTVTPLYGSTAWDKLDGVVTVKKAEKVSGELTGFKDNESVTFGGSTVKINYYNGTDTYKASGSDTKVAVDAKFQLLSEIPDIDSAKIITKFDYDDTKNSLLDKEYDFYMVNGYVGAVVKTSKDNNNYSVVTEVKKAGQAGSTFDGLQLKVMAADGTTEIITVNDESVYGKNSGKTGKAILASDYAVGTIVTYSFDKKGEAEVTVEAIPTTTTVTYNDSAKTVDTKTTVADCVAYVQTSENKVPTAKETSVANAKYKAYDIRALKSFTSPTNAVTTVAKNNDGKVVAVFVDMAKTPSGASDKDVYGIISAYNGRVKDFYSYTISSNGTDYTVLSKSSNQKTGTVALKKGKLVKFSPNAIGEYEDGEIELITEKVGPGANDSIQAVYIDSYSSGDKTLTFFGALMPKATDKPYEGDKGKSYTYALEKDCQIVYVDTDADTSTGEGSVSQFSKVNGYKNAYIVTEDDKGSKVIVALFVDGCDKQDITKQ